MASENPAQPRQPEQSRTDERQRWLRQIDRALDELKGTDSPTIQALLRG